MKYRLRRSFLHTVMPAVCFGALTGMLTATAVNLYKVLAKYAISYSEQGYHFIRHHLYLIPVVLAVFLIPALLFSHIYKRVPNLRGGGIPTSIGILRGIIPFKWVRNFFGILGMSLCSFLIGVPLGNEGPSVQMGVAVGRGSVYCFGKRQRAWDRYSMTGGACAGFSVATGAPISGGVFAVEEAHQRICPMILTVATTSVMFASLTTELLAPLFGVSKSLFPAMSLPSLDVKDVWIPLVVGIAVGLFAVLFLTYYRFIFGFFNKTLHKIPHGWRIFSVFAMTLAVGLCSFSFVDLMHTVFKHAVIDGFRTEQFCDGKRHARHYDDVNDVIVAGKRLYGKNDGGQWHFHHARNAGDDPQHKNDRVIGMIQSKRQFHRLGKQCRDQRTDGKQR